LQTTSRRPSLLTVRDPRLNEERKTRMKPQGRKREKMGKSKTTTTVKQLGREEKERCKYAAARDN